jgi:hypothetical protein
MVLGQAPSPFAAIAKAALIPTSLSWHPILRLQTETKSRVCRATLASAASSLWLCRVTGDRRAVPLRCEFATALLHPGPNRPCSSFPETTLASLLTTRQPATPSPPTRPPFLRPRASPPAPSYPPTAACIFVITGERLPCAPLRLPASLETIPAAKSRRLTKQTLRTSLAGRSCPHHTRNTSPTLRLVFMLHRIEPVVDSIPQISALAGLDGTSLRITTPHRHLPRPNNHPPPPSPWVAE